MLIELEGSEVNIVEGTVDKSVSFVRPVGILDSFENLTEFVLTEEPVDIVELFFLVLLIVLCLLDLYFIHQFFYHMRATFELLDHSVTQLPDEQWDFSFTY